MDVCRRLRWLACLAAVASSGCMVCLTAGCASLGSWSPLAATERRSIFQPDKYPAGDWNPTAVLVQDAQFAAADGTKLHGWYVRHPQPLAHALVLHGNAGNVTLLAESLRILNRRHQLAVLALDYRGYGRSEGKPTEAGVLLDARAARRWLAEKEGIAETDVVLVGYSLGGGVAVDLAAEDGARGLVLASTFTSLPDLAEHHMSWLPMSWLMTMQMSSLEKIKRYRGPLLLSHGDADEVVPYSQGLALFQAANEPKRLVTIRGGKHNDPQPEEYRVALDQFLADLPPLVGQASSLPTPTAGWKPAPLAQ
ncbi:MAG: alpha/beta hydrolase, partial [Planctomycetaceae bacterium]|nr:alpha/beta hydrolase [Planctomycetaceae bacterium]